MGIITLTMSALLSFGKVGPSTSGGPDAAKTITEIVDAGKEILGLENVNIRTRSLTYNIRKQINTPYSMYAFVAGKNGNYIMYISPRLKDNRLIEVIAHELIHVHQIESGRLKIEKEHVIFYNRKYRNPKNIFYSDRKWEMEAFQKQYKLKRKIISVL